MTTTMNQIVMSFVVCISLGLILSLPHVNAACPPIEKAISKYFECQGFLRQAESSSTPKQKCGYLKEAMSCFKELGSYCDLYKSKIGLNLREVKKSLSKYCGAGAA